MPSKQILSAAKDDRILWEHYSFYKRISDVISICCGSWPSSAARRSPAEKRDDQRGDKQRGQEVADAHIFERQQLEADGQHDQTSGGSHLVDHGRGEQVAQPERAQADRALKDEQDDSGSRDAPTQRGGEGERGEAVESAFQGQGGELPGQTLLDAAEHGHRADTPDEAGGDKAFAEA